ncbi:MAG: hypothetical protein M1831_003418 [Alyxoria varia]|nr:MAG: hypothetical protein M1831_003418 [Alyxoria varia]
MLDAFEILTTSGVVLWSRNYAPVGVNIVNSLIKQVFIEDNAQSAPPLNDASASRNPAFKSDKHTVKWTAAKDFGLVFVAVYQSLIHLSWIDKLLDNVKTLFTSLYRDELRKPNTSVVECNFDEYFDRQVQELEKTAKHATAEPRKKDDGVSRQADETLAPPGDSRKQAFAEDTSNDASPIITPDSSRPASPAAGVVTGKDAPGGRLSRKARRKANTNASAPASRDLSATGKSKPGKGKKMRRWDADGLMDDAEEKVLDYSTPTQDAAKVAASDDNDNQTSLEPIQQQEWGRKTNKGEFVLKDLDEEMDSILNSAEATKQNGNALPSDSKGGLVNTGLGAISGLFRNAVGGKTLTASDLSTPLKAMEDHLIKRNVARDAASHLCSAVSRDLVGTKTPSFTTIDTTIRTSLDTALSKILTPTSGSTLDLLRSIETVRSSAPSTRRPYVISVVGVNGVGKSTTLAKLAFLLLHNNYRVLVAAADTFRSGAVEQLRVHVRNLQQLTARSTDSARLGHIDLYERGYGKDAAHIARDAVAHAAKPTGSGETPYDVVLIDTAGRRHNDQRLMASLAPFARAANPDKILMVGEALVGTDSVAQAQHFNASFGPGRKLDGFIVSKCDTVGEMVGTLVSLVWSTGVPVVAVGVGQHYGDLRGFKVGWARDLLLKG